MQYFIIVLNLLPFAFLAGVMVYSCYLYYKKNQTIPETISNILSYYKTDETSSDYSLI